jgi:uncharacterized OB-fold protein
MGDSIEGVDILTSNERPRMWRFSYSAGPIRSKFLLFLRDQQRIMGTKCPVCRKVYVPARSVCAACYQDLEEWVEVSTRGVLETYTIVHKADLAFPSGTPVALGVIKLDGADTGIVHRLGEVDFDQIRIGMRVKAVFNKERKGDIRDIGYFKPVESK